MVYNRASVESVSRIVDALEKRISAVEKVNEELRKELNKKTVEENDDGKEPETEVEG